MDTKLAHFFSGERSQLLNLYGQARAQYLEYLRREILLNDRIDLLATQVLGYELHPFHRQMLQVQFLHPNNLQLVGRGFGKSTICTVTKCIHYLCKYPKARIVIASKTMKQAQARLKEISAHLAENQLLIELFGNFYNKNLWNAREIEILQRYDPKNKRSPGASSLDATPSVACVGAKGSIAGAHFDIEFSDDLIDKTNSHSELTREEVNDWYNATFTPMLDPSDPSIPFRGHRHRVGTRYHYLDQYGRWIKQATEAYKTGVHPNDRMWINVIPAYDYRDTRADKLYGLGLGVYSGTGSGRSPWPDRWTIQELLKRKRDGGRLAFEAQYLNDISAQNGEIFDYDDFIEVPEDEVKKLYPSMRFYIGCDLAISQRETADSSAFIVVGKHVNGRVTDYYIVDTTIGRFRFGRQTREIVKLHDKWNKVGMGVGAIGVEATQYQQAQIHHLEDTTNLKSKIKRVMPRSGDDKVARAHRRTPLVEGGRVKLMTRAITIDGEETTLTIGSEVRDQMVQMPNGDYDDGFDGFDHALTVSKRGGAMRREKEVGLL